ncbi:MAG: hypothetical protein BRC44_15245 [Cyanobacteria bacterium QS_4_48_99]|nr:MAG: hypothetical protein BRC44_15245 [Cyanobacteria bacterium QS_4_48_99]
MLAYILAIAVGLGSFALYITAFFFPELHRKSDFFWSGLGLFYALVLWVCAGRITGGVLLGQLAGVSLLGWLGWQTLTLRSEVSEQLEGFSLNKLLKQVTSLFRRLKPEAKTPQTSTPTEESPELSATEAAPTPAEPPSEQTESSPEVSKQAQSSLFSKFFNRFTSPFRRGKPKANTSQTSTLAEALSESSATEPPEAATPAEEPSELESQPTSPEQPEPEDVEAARKETESKEASTPVEEAVVEAARPEVESPETDETTPAEEVAPEAELAPSAESPGEGDVEARQSRTEQTPSEQESRERRHGDAGTR